MTDRQTSHASGYVGGVDGAPGGWVMAVTNIAHGDEVEFSLWTTFGDLWEEARRKSLVAVGIDMPIGLPSTTRRSADAQARELLGTRRASLFWSPPVAALDASNHGDANRATREHLGMGLSKQSFNLLPKIRAVRAALIPADFDIEAMPRAAEVHPELSFAVMAAAIQPPRGTDEFGLSGVAAKPLQHAKRHQAGIAQRLTLLDSFFARVTESAALKPLVGPPHPTLDDLLDAAAAAWTARRIATGQATYLGAVDGQVPIDSHGYPLVIAA